MDQARIGKSSLILRSVYWCVLAGSTGFVAWWRRGFIWPGALTPLDEGVLVFLGILLLIPLVGEFEAFGLKFRRQIEEVKTELGTRIDLLSATVSASATVRNEFNFVAALPTPADLERLRTAVVEKEQPSDRPTVPDLSAKVPEDAKYLFEARYLLEQALEGLQLGLRAPRKPMDAVRGLGDEGYLSSDEVAAFRQVWSISSRAIHGEAIEAEYVVFVRETMPVLLAALRHINVATDDDG